MNLPKKLEKEVEEKSKTLPEEVREKFVEKVKEEYQRRLVDVGEPVGLVAAQSISEPTTQLVLRSFHYVGMREFQVVLGLPRLMEIVDARKRMKNRQMKIHLLEEYKDNREIAEKVAMKIVETRIEDVADRIDFDILNNRIIIYLDEDYLKKIEKTVEDVYSLLKRRLKKYDVEREDNKVIISAKELKPKELYVLKENIKKIQIAGIKGIKQVFVQREGEEWVIYTNGSNLKEVMRIPEVDYRRVFTNDIHEIERVLGIEAARRVILEEMIRIFESYGLRVDYRHFSLVADVLTWYGEYKGITRYGIIAEKTSTLSRAAFEVPIKHFTNAAMMGIEDEISSVIDNLLVNQVVPIGTGLFDVYYKRKEK